jgi:hypothetical protein
MSIRTGDRIEYDSEVSNATFDKLGKSLNLGTAVRAYPKFVLVRLDNGLHESPGYFDIHKVNGKPFGVYAGKGKGKGNETETVKK